MDTQTRVLFLTLSLVAAAEQWQQNLCKFFFPLWLDKEVNGEDPCNTLDQGCCLSTLCIFYLVFLLSCFFHRKVYTARGLLSVLYSMFSPNFKTEIHADNTLKLKVQAPKE